MIISLSEAFTNQPVDSPQGQRFMSFPLRTDQLWNPHNLLLSDGHQVW